jgi:hypothetical protein
MLSINKKLFLTISYQRLFSCSSILSGYSISSHSNNKRHRISTSSPHHHLPHRITSNNQTNSVRRLFQPIDVKPMTTTNKLDSISSKDSNTNIGQELTGGKTLERSMRKTRNFILYYKKNFHCLLL